MPIRDLKDQIARLPQQPGVYLYFNQAGDTIYVGKARVLRDRVRSYLGAYGLHPKTDALLEEADRLDVIVTDSVMEALALENNLIKQRSPRYNVLLRDDKNYPYLQMTTSEAFPRVQVARRVERNGDFFAGPFLPASLGRKTINLTHRLFGLRSCNEVITGQRGRPCLEYDIGRCLAPCVVSICTQEEYGRAVADTRLFLEGRNDELLSDLGARMLEAAASERFEQAAHLRDAMKTIETLRDRQQKMAGTRFGDRDVFGLRIGPAASVVQIFQVRRGRVVDRVELVTDAAEAAAGARDVEVLEAALQQFYESQDPPPEIHVPVALEDPELMEAWLSSRAERKVTIAVPKRGEKRGLLELAMRNASLAYDQRAGGRDMAQFEALETLRVTLALPAVPRRIECFDISTIQGAETVASMVVCEDGRMKRSDYRKFRIKGDRGLSLVSRPDPTLPDVTPLQSLEGGADTGSTNGTAAAPSVSEAAMPAPAATGGVPGRVLDDFASMHEVVLRRYRRLSESGGPFPDLIVIDGGKGQLSAAYEALRALGLERLIAVGLAKQEELIFTRDSFEPIALPRESSALRLLQRIRDEAHRFAVTFHRQSRTKRDLSSELDTVPGIGPRRRKTLLTRFGSLTGVRRATREELTAAVGAKAAAAVLDYFSGR
jgi:excinuclease ABC subunit C